MNVKMKPLMIFVALLLIASVPGCGSQEYSGQESLSQSPNVPQGAWSNHQVISNRFAPAGFGAVVAWAQAATLSKVQAGLPAKIEVDYMRLVEEDSVTGTSILTEESYDGAGIQGLSIKGALYDRSPTWFANNDHHVTMFNSAIQNSVLTIDVSQSPDNIAHWWTERRPCKPTATYYVEMRVRITGQVGLQLGGDFWTTLTSSWAGYNVNNREYFASDWYGDTNGQFIIIKAPNL